jgi:DNA invertase Pin-like site-specific DNA recombinase
MLREIVMQAFIAYYRVSTERQGRSGLGLDAQREAAERHVQQHGGQILAEFIEVESGTLDRRPTLEKALAAARAHGATLIVAKLDRLARSARFLLSIVEGAGEGGVVFCDLPQIPAGPVGKFLLTQMAAVAELEAGLISERTKAALKAAKARGVKLGNPRLRAGDRQAAMKASQAASDQAAIRAAEIRPFVDQARAAGATSLAQIARALEARGVRTPRGNANWSPAQVARLIAA